MEVVKHRHPLILNECFHGGEGDACYLCKEPLLSPLAHSVYFCSSSSLSADYDVDCVKLFVHKTCAELPLKITNYFMHPQHPISLVPTFPPPIYLGWLCSVCSEGSYSMFRYSCESCSEIEVCFKCVTSPHVYHPGHSQHALTLVQRPASFRCYACDKTELDSSSCKCNICPFWIHMSCALLPSRFQSQFHKHPLVLAYSLPEQYFKFSLPKCKICLRNMKPKHWLYYCASCRFFVHILCAHSTPIAYPDTEMRTMGEFENLVDLPAPDQSSLKLLQQFFIHQMISNHEADEALSWSFSSLSTITTATPDTEVINHWSHVQHPLTLRNKCSTATDTQLMIMKGSDEANDTTIMVCDGCTNPIYPSDISYECHLCKYFLHRCCAEVPKQLECDTLQPGISLVEFDSKYLFICRGCTFLRSGIHIATENGKFRLDIGCASLPVRIKHEAHAHPLIRYISDNIICYACGKYFKTTEIVFSCDVACSFAVHATCALKPHKLEHRWDSHPLTLIMNPENIIEDHPHDYNCEHCSEDIDPNYWFYHCSLCDLSCHMACTNKFDRYSNINFRSSSNKIDHQLHEHGLTLVQNKRKRCCRSCHRQIYDAPVLECTPCKFIICMSCVDPNQFDYYVACGRSEIDFTFDRDRFCW